MTVIVTRDVEARYRGFLASAMLEVAPGVYTSPRLSKAVRERIWAVLEDWYGVLRRGSIVMTWRDTSASGGQRLLSLGELPRSFAEVDGLVIVKRDLGL